MPNVNGSAPLLRRLATDAGKRARGRHRIEAVAVDLFHQRGVQRRRYGDGVAVEPEIERRCDRHLDVPEPEARGDCHRRQQMSGVEQADIELVADVRPRHFPYQRNIEAFSRRESLVDRDDQGGSVHQRNESDVQGCGHFRSSDAVRIDCAISPIFFFSRIAVERIST
ncbi:hypothetical protein ACVWY2_001278 [Bradyrhizobium sp. JR6.1]